MIKYTIFRPAIAMIELIFAIVIMGIVIMSAPMLVSTASKSGFVAMQQEGISEVASQLNMILSYAWDENNADPTLGQIILATSVNNNALALTLPAAAPTRRAGTPASSSRIFIIDPTNPHTATPAQFLGNGEGGSIDDIDDFHGNTADLRLEGAGGPSDYIQKVGDINIAKTVSYVSDAPSLAGAYDTANLVYGPFVLVAGATVSTHIKSIAVTITSAVGQATELDKTITLQAFSCNIGSHTLQERPAP